MRIVPALLKLYPSAPAFVVAGVETLAAKLHELAPRNYGLHTAEQLVSLAQHSVSSGVALAARSTSLKILCDQLEHTQTNLLQLEKELEALVKTDKGAKGLQSVPEFAGKTIAVLRAELGDVDRFACSNRPGEEYFFHCLSLQISSFPLDKSPIRNYAF